MMRNHVLHKAHIVDGVAGIGHLNRLLGSQKTRRLTGRAGLDDGAVCVDGESQCQGHESRHYRE